MKRSAIGIFVIATYLSAVPSLFASQNTIEFDLEVVDSLGWVGSNPSLVTDHRGDLHVSYTIGSLAGNLKYGKRIGSTWFLETIDSGQGGIGRTSLALDNLGQPHIALSHGNPYVGVNQDLKYATKVNGEWSVETIEDEGEVGIGASLDLGRNGEPHISYVDRTKGEVKYATKVGSEWIIETIDSSMKPGGTSLKLDRRGIAHVAYGEGFPHLDCFVSASMGQSQGLS